MATEQTLELVEGILNVRVTESGPVCVLNECHLMPSRRTCGNIQINNGYSLLEGTVPFAYGSDVLCNRRAILSHSGSIASLSTDNSIDIEDVVSIEIAYEYDRFHLTYFLSSRVDLKLITAIKGTQMSHLVSRSLSELNGEESVIGMLVASKDLCFLTDRYPSGHNGPQITIDHKMWFPVLKRQIPANNQPHWPRLIVPAAVSGAFDNGSLEQSGQCYSASHIICQFADCLQMISLGGKYERWVYQDVLFR